MKQINQKKFDAILNILSAIVCLLIFICLTPAFYSIWHNSAEMDIQFHWWDKASFILGPIGFLCAILGVGIKGILGLKNSD